jgi:NAD(P)-dependent dehydrogenase (short-subunit alcohol dehydrogenase family)
MGSRNELVALGKMHVDSDKPFSGQFEIISHQIRGRASWAAVRHRKEFVMAQRKVWLITGAARGLGRDIAKAALNAGHAVVASGRDPKKIVAAVGSHANLLAVQLDVTKPADALAAVEAAVRKFGTLDVVINNAGNFFAGFFEELTTEQVRDQLEVLLFGPMNVARAALPVMRKQRSGLLVTISSTAGITGGMFCSAYAAAKFGLEGWMESLTPEIATFGIKTMLVEPGFFRTELLSKGSTTYAPPSIDDYAERTKETIDAWSGMHGKQGGDPVKLATALVRLAGGDSPPARFAAGADAVKTFENKADALREQANAYRDLSSSLACAVDIER